MTNSTVLRNVNWLHKLVYMARGQPTIYENLSIPLHVVFVSGYIAILEITRLAPKPIIMRHLKELMADTKLYHMAGSSCMLIMLSGFSSSKMAG